MARLIDADAIKYRTDGCGGWGIPENVVSDYEIAKMPTIDAVPVVRCKDCKYYELDEGDFLGECHCKCIPMNYGGELYPERDFFCAYGERK
jgi:hypothetical protein